MLGLSFALPRRGFRGPISLREPIRNRAPAGVRLPGSAWPNWRKPRRTIPGNDRGRRGSLNAPPRGALNPREERMSSYIVTRIVGGAWRKWLRARRLRFQGVRAPHLEPT